MHIQPTHNHNSVQVQVHIQIDTRFTSLSSHRVQGHNKYKTCDESKYVCTHIEVQSSSHTSHIIIITTVNTP